MSLLLRPFFLYNEVFNESYRFFSAKKKKLYCLTLLQVNVIFVTINYLVRHVSTCIGHLQVSMKRNEGFVVYFT
jgi:hypothetical protein